MVPGVRLTVTALRVPNVAPEQPIPLIGPLHTRHQRLRRCVAMRMRSLSCLPRVECNDMLPPGACARSGARESSGRFTNPQARPHAFGCHSSVHPAPACIRVRCTSTSFPAGSCRRGLEHSRRRNSAIGRPCWVQRTCSATSTTLHAQAPLLPSEWRASWTCAACHPSSHNCAAESLLVLHR